MQTATENVKKSRFISGSSPYSIWITCFYFPLKNKIIKLTTFEWLYSLPTQNLLPSSLSHFCWRTSHLWIPCINNKTQRGWLFPSWPVLFGWHFFDIYPILMNLFANEQKNGPSFRNWNVWRPISSSFNALFLLNPLNKASFWCFWFSKHFWAFSFYFFPWKKHEEGFGGVLYTS